MSEPRTIVALLILALGTTFLGAACAGAPSGSPGNAQPTVAAGDATPPPQSAAVPGVTAGQAASQPEPGAPAASLVEPPGVESVSADAAASSGDPQSAAITKDRSRANDRATGGAGIAAVTPPPTVAIGIPANETIVAIATPTPTVTRTPTTTPTPQPGGAGPTIGGCAVFPANNAWNADISGYAVHPNSANYVAAINATGGTGFLHADFGGGGAYGIPYIVVPASQPLVPVVFTDYGDESDPGPYPIPLTAPIEGGSDAHVLAVRQGECKLYELFASYTQGGSWYAASGAVWNLNSNALRPAGWTSADAAGLPILPGLARYDEAQAGAIRHALRFTVKQTQRGYILPATHWASSSTNPNLPPMGLRFRLKASYDISGYTGEARVILQALRTYGMIVADNGSNWYISGAADTRWDDDDLNQLKLVPGTAFEAVNTGPIVTP